VPKQLFFQKNDKTPEQLGKLNASLVIKSDERIMIRMGSSFFII
jgi:hypothetical protein